VRQPAGRREGHSCASTRSVLP